MTGDLMNAVRSGPNRFSAVHRAGEARIGCLLTHSALAATEAEPAITRPIDGQFLMTPPGAADDRPDGISPCSDHPGKVR